TDASLAKPTEGRGVNWRETGGNDDLRLALFTRGNDVHAELVEIGRPAAAEAPVERAPQFRAGVGPIGIAQGGGDSPLRGRVKQMPSLVDLVRISNNDDGRRGHESSTE